MKKLHSILSVVGVLVLLAGCQSSSTTAVRIQEKSAMFSALPAEQQKKIQDGVVEVGFTADMVYVALGRPTQVSVTADGKVGIWSYANYYPTEAVSSQPFYAIRPHPRPRSPLIVGPSAGSAHDGGAMGPVARGPREGGPLGTGWVAPDYDPVTLHISFRGGRVFQMAATDGSS